MKISIFHIAQSIDIKKFLKKFPKHVFREPAILKISSSQWLVVLKFGVVIFWGVSTSAAEQWLKKIKSFCKNPLSEILTEELDINAGKSRNTVINGTLQLSTLNTKNIGLTSLVLGRSIALENYELDVDKALTQFNPVMESFEKTGHSKMGSKTLLKMLGKAMNVQHSIVSHLTLLDRPEIAWEEPALDKFFDELNTEYELEDRYEILSEKLKLLFQHIEFIQNYLDTRRGLLLEWTIVILILLEILLFTYELWF